MGLIRIFFAAMLAIWLVAPTASADRAEPEARSNTRQPSAAAGEVDLSKPAEVRVNYKQTSGGKPAAAPTPLLSKKTQQAATPRKASTRKVRRSSTKRRKARRRKKTRTVRRAAAKPAAVKVRSQPSVQTFMDCAALHMADLPASRTERGARLAISSAMDTVCRQEFNTMAEKIVARYGNKRFTRISQQVIGELVQNAINSTRAGNTTLEQRAQSGG